jgi:hypothetical protein
MFRIESLILRKYYLECNARFDPARGIVTHFSPPSAVNRNNNLIKQTKTHLRAQSQHHQTRGGNTSSSDSSFSSSFSSFFSSSTGAVPPGATAPPEAAGAAPAEPTNQNKIH